MAGLIPLRRADWRFLLPCPPAGRYRRLVLLGGDEDLSLRLANLADEVTTDPRDVETADLVVLMADAIPSVEHILERARPDAVLYVEVDRRRRGRRGLTPARLRVKAGKAGFSVRATYWVIPEFSRARRHIPLHAPQVLSWYLGTLQTAGSPVARLGDAGVRVLARMGADRLAAWVPCFSITAVGRAHRGAPLGIMAPSPAPVAMITSGQDDGSRVVLLPFENGGALPSRVLKVPRLAAFEGHTVREQQTLSEFRARLPLAVRSTLPEPLGVRRWQGHLVAAESYAPGPAVVLSSGRYGAPFAAAEEDLHHAVEWLIHFQTATRVADAVWSPELAGRTAQRLESCRKLYGASSPALPLLAAAAQRALQLVGRRLPVAPLHNDLGPWNIHRDGTRVTVIDWELGDDSAASRHGPGACDLFYLVIHWYFRVRHLRTLRAEARGLRELFGERSGGAVARAAHEQIRRYARAMELESAFLPLLLVTTLVERALDREERSRRAEAGAPSENRYARYVASLGERSEAWFERGGWP